ncbi:MAG: hypothetical protein WKG07_43225 [Hymenobacter sp.]
MRCWWPGQGKNIGRYNGAVNRLSLRRKLLYYWQYPVALLGLAAHWRAAGPWRFFDLIFYAIGYYEVYRRALRHYRPRAVVFANDHNDDTRALLLACRAEGVPTAYVQHASVSANFPPLGFDLSLLEGQDALDKYRQCGPVRGRVELVGMPKADAYLSQRNTAPAVRRVGRGLQHATTRCPALTDTLAYLLRELPDADLHPAPPPQRPPRLRRRCARPLPALQWSDARQENVFEFLQTAGCAGGRRHLHPPGSHAAQRGQRLLPLRHQVPLTGRLLRLRRPRPQRVGPRPRRAGRRAGPPSPAQARSTSTAAPPTTTPRLGTPDEGHSRALAPAPAWREWLAAPAERRRKFAASCPAPHSAVRPPLRPSRPRRGWPMCCGIFALAYPGAPAVGIGYAGTQPRAVEVADLSGSFFSEINPYPPRPRWREWQGRQVPFFFDDAARQTPA